MDLEMQREMDERTRSHVPSQDRSQSRGYFVGPGQRQQPIPGGAIQGKPDFRGVEAVRSETAYSSYGQGELLSKIKQLHEKYTIPIANVLSGGIHNALENSQVLKNKKEDLKKKSELYKNMIYTVTGDVKSLKFPVLTTTCTLKFTTQTTFQDNQLIYCSPDNAFKGSYSKAAAVTGDVNPKARFDFGFTWMMTSDVSVTGHVLFFVNKSTQEAPFQFYQKDVMPFEDFKKIGNIKILYAAKVNYYRVKEAMFKRYTIGNYYPATKHYTNNIEFEGTQIHSVFIPSQKFEPKNLTIKFNRKSMHINTENIWENIITEKLTLAQAVNSYYYIKRLKEREINNTYQNYPKMVARNLGSILTGSNNRPSLSRMYKV